MSWCQNCQRHHDRGYRVVTCPGDICTRCPWPGCPCTHTMGCDRGYIETEPVDETSNGAVRRCLTCRDWAESGEMHPPERGFRVAS